MKTVTAVKESVANRARNPTGPPPPQSRIASWQFSPCFRVVPVEGGDETWVKHLRSRDPGAFLRIITLPVHRVLKAFPPSTCIQQTSDHEGMFIVDQTGVGIEVGRRT